MKAVISNKIYLNTDKALEEKIKEALTYKFYDRHNKRRPFTIERHYSRFKDDILIIPQGRIDLIPEDYEIVDKRRKVPVVFPKFRGELRPSQETCVKTINDSWMINAGVSWGKTYAGLGVAKKLGQKTLIVVHTIVLRNQWEEKVKELFGFQPGIIGSGRLETDSPIVIGNVQTLRKHITKLRDAFGTVLLDEMHHVSAPTFENIVSESRARYRIGLSATLQRKDGRHITFPDYFGQNIFDAPKENSIDPVIYSVNTGIRLPQANVWANRLSKLYEMPEYMNLVLAMCQKAKDCGHTTLVIADRVEFLQELHKRFPDSVCVTGEVKEDREELQNLVRNKQKSALFGTRSIYSEGISINSLSCLILASPINNEFLLEQLIGRIQRVEKGKPLPVVIDLQLEGNTGYSQYCTRMRHYRDNNYKFISGLDT